MCHASSASEDWKKGKDPHPQDKIQHLLTLLRTPGRFTTRPLRVYFTTKMSVARPLPVFSKDDIGPYRGNLKGWFPKGWFWADVPPERKPERGCVRMFGTRVRSDVPPERKPERGYVRMFPRNEHRNEGTFAKTTLLRNRPFISR